MNKYYYYVVYSYNLVKQDGSILISGVFTTDVACSELITSMKTIREIEDMCLSRTKEIHAGSNCEVKGHVSFYALLREEKE